MVLRSEDDIAMDVDLGSRGKQGSDGLEQYKLDDYDDEAKTSSMVVFQFSFYPLLIEIFRYGCIQQH